MKNEITTPAQIIKQLLNEAVTLRNQGYWLMLGALTVQECAACTLHPQKKRKAYAAQARKEFKQAAECYAQAAIKYEAWLKMDNTRMLWIYKKMPQLLALRSQKLMAKSKEMFKILKAI